MRFSATVLSLALATNVAAASNWFSKAGESKSGKGVVAKAVDFSELRALFILFARLC